MSLSKIKEIYHSTFMEAIEEPLYLYALALLVFLAISLAVVRNFKRELIPVFSDEEGLVKITPHALHELVRKTCDVFPEVNSPSTRIRLKGKELRLDIHIKVKPDCNIKETRTSIKERLEEIMVENLNFSNFGGVDIVIKGFQTES
jgi:divalent metal cation (Fe/Co/Zn/Cd) transporter